MEKSYLIYGLERKYFTPAETKVLQQWMVDFSQLRKYGNQQLRLAADTLAPEVFFFYFSPYERAVKEPRSGEHESRSGKKGKQFFNTSFY